MYNEQNIKETRTWLKKYAPRLICSIFDDLISALSIYAKDYNRLYNECHLLLDDIYKQKKTLNKNEEKRLANLIGWFDKKNEI